MDDTSEKNKRLVLEAFNTLFNKRDYDAAEKFWSPNYIQHSAHIGPGREGLFTLIKSIPPTLRYEHGAIVADGDFVMLQWSIFGHGAAGKLGCGRHPSHQGRASSRTLGRYSRRNLAQDFQERPSHVRQYISRIIPEFRSRTFESGAHAQV